MSERGRWDRRDQRTRERSGVLPDSQNPQASQGAKTLREAGSAQGSRRSEAERFEAMVDRSGGPDACHPWTGAKTWNGYGRFRVWRDGRWTVIPAHRWAYEQAYGPLPAELTPDHTCHNRDLDCPGGLDCPHRACCNPAHGEAVTHAENGRRVQERRRAVARRKEAS